MELTLLWISFFFFLFRKVLLVSFLVSVAIFQWFIYLFNMTYSFIWWCWVSAAACGIFSLWPANSQLQSVFSLVLWAEIEPRSFALRAQSVSHWNIREVPAKWVMLSYFIDGENNTQDDLKKNIVGETAMELRTMSTNFSVKQPNNVLYLATLLLPTTEPA